MNESDLSSATHSSEDKEKNISDKEKRTIDEINPDDMIEIIIDDPKPPAAVQMTEKQMCTPKNCCEKIKSFYCGRSLSYFSCVLMYGCFPGIAIFLCFAIISGVVWGIVGGTTGMIVGITFLCLCLFIPLLMINLAALYAYCYPSDNVGSLGYCCFCCKK